MLHRWQNLGRSLETVNMLHNGAKHGPSHTKRLDEYEQPTRKGIPIDCVHEYKRPPRHLDGSGLQSKLPGISTPFEKSMPTAPLHLKRPRNSENKAQSEEQVWFEVSQHTSKVYVHYCEDGSVPMFSIPLESLLLDHSPQVDCLRDILVDKLTISDADSVESMGPFGLIKVRKMHLANPLQIDNLIKEAREFAHDWNEIRAVFKKKLYGKVGPHYIG